MSESIYRPKKNKHPLSEDECMIKFYEPLENKQKVLSKWLKPPER